MNGQRRKHVNLMVDKRVSKSDNCHSNSSICKQIAGHLKQLILRVKIDEVEQSKVCEVAPISEVVVVAICDVIVVTMA